MKFLTSNTEFNLSSLFELGLKCDLVRFDKHLSIHSLKPTSNSPVFLNIQFICLIRFFSFFLLCQLLS